MYVCMSNIDALYLILVNKEQKNARNLANKTNQQMKEKNYRTVIAWIFNWILRYTSFWWVSLSFERRRSKSVSIASTPPLSLFSAHPSSTKSRGFWILLEQFKAKASCIFIFTSNSEMLQTRIECFHIMGIRMFFLPCELLWVSLLLLAAYVFLFDHSIFFKSYKCKSL